METSVPKFLVHVFQCPDFFSKMKGAVSITIWFLTAFSCMKYVQIKFPFSKK